MPSITPRDVDFGAYQSVWTTCTRPMEVDTVVSTNICGSDRRMVRGWITARRSAVCGFNQTSCTVGVTEHERDQGVHCACDSTFKSVRDTPKPKQLPRDPRASGGESSVESRHAPRLQAANGGAEE